MDNKQPNNPLHGIKLSEIVEYLYNEYGWEKLGKKIKINCFTNDPSVKSSLKFLRKTDWARTEVENLYLWNQRKNANKKINKRKFEPKVEKVEKVKKTEQEGQVEKLDQLKETEVPKVRATARKFRRK